MKIAINGFGRIGKTFLRTLLLNKKASQKIEVAAINVGPRPIDHIATLFKYDSIMGTLPFKVEYSNNQLSIDNIKIKVISESNPLDTNWKDLGVDWVIESSGYFTSKAGASQHLEAGAKNVLITAPCEDADLTIIPGINLEEFDASSHKVVSLGSCTTNCIVPLIKVIKDNFEIQSGIMTTIHAYTNDQVLLDIEHPDPRRARAASLNIIPTRTGAQKLIEKIFPDLNGKIEASAIRIPTPVVSLVDFTFVSSKTLAREELNNKFESAAQKELKGILKYTEEPLVSTDYQGDPHSCIYDSLLTKAIGNIGQVFGWYDNEWGYSQRLNDFLLHNS